MAAPHALLQRLQPLLSGVQSAEDFVQELLMGCLNDLTQRIACHHDLSKQELDRHAAVVMDGMRIRIKPGPDSKLAAGDNRRLCRGRTRAKQRCKNRAQPLSDFCRRHADQRDRYERDRAARAQLKEHLFVMNAGLAEHTHRWDGTYVKGCAACQRNADSGDARSFSGVTCQTQDTASSSFREAAERSIASAPTATATATPTPTATATTATAHA